MSDDEEIVYEPRPKVVSLSGAESVVDATQLARACWLLKRYTSYSYVERIASLFNAVVDAYEAWPAKVQRLSAEYAERTGATLDEHRNAFRVGLANLRNGYPSDAYNAIFRAVSGLEPSDPRDERSLSLSLLLDELGASVSREGTMAASMARRTEHTLGAMWSYELIFANRLSVQFAPKRYPEPLPAVSLPDKKAPRISTGESVRETGIYIPIAIQNGCPNFLVAGFAAPEIRYPYQRIDYAELKAAGGEAGREAWSDYEYETSETEWRLLWADARYDDGVRDEDPAYLDDENSVN